MYYLCIRKIQFCMLNLFSLQIVHTSLSRGEAKARFLLHDAALNAYIISRHRLYIFTHRPFRLEYKAGPKRIIINSQIVQRILKIFLKFSRFLNCSFLRICRRKYYKNNSGKVTCITIGIPENLLKYSYRPIFKNRERTTKHATNIIYQQHYTNIIILHS